MKRIFAGLLCCMLLCSCAANEDTESVLSTVPQPSSLPKASVDTTAQVPSTPEPTAQPASSPMTVPETTTPVTAKPSEAPVQPTLPAWKSAYLNYISSYEAKDDCDYRLVHVDSDGIPELFISGCCEAQGSEICSFSGQLTSVHLRRIGGAYYISNSGLIYNRNGNMGYYSTNIYRLSSGSFTGLFSGVEEWTVREYTDENGETQYEELVTYYIGGQTVTQEEFDAQVAAVFDLNSANALYSYGSSDLRSYNQICQEITNW